jgi:hypothetical protein
MIKENESTHQQRMTEATGKRRASSAAFQLPSKKKNEKFEDIREDQLDFKAKVEDEVIKVSKCTYANDIKTSTIFYFCQCSAEDFYPICEACAQKCHKSHYPALRLEGIYTCMCGKGNHVISKDNEKRIKEKKLKMQNQCFFSKFMEITPNRGFFTFRSSVYCSICVEYCLHKKFDELEQCIEMPEGLPRGNSISGNNYMTCQCEKHYEMNVITLNVDLISKPKFHLYLQNFNFNILSKIPFSKQMYIDYFVGKIRDFHVAPGHENSKNFFTNFINFKILELFSAFAVRWENKFFHVKGYLKDIPNETLFRLMTFDEPMSMIGDTEAADFATSKFNFAEYMFNYITRTHMIKYNNLLNIRTILNMNLYQRFIYLQEIKNFFKFNYFDEENTQSYEHTFIEMGLIFLDLYENILKVNETFDFTDRIMSYVFPTFNRIFKYLIKYNLVNEEVKTKYFELVLETINLVAESENPNHEGSAFYVIKSVLYTLVYRNDRVCINYIKGQKDPHNKNFVFQTNPESDNLCKIFINLVNKFNRTEDLNKTIIYDFYVRKIFELMVGKNEFYVNSLENLLSDNFPTYQLQLLSSDSVQELIKNQIYLPFMKEIINLTTRMNSANRDYFDYNINYEGYLITMNMIFRDFKSFIFSEINYLPDLNKKYQVFDEKWNLDDITVERITEIQKCIKYTLFFQKIEEFLHIFSEGKTYHKLGQGEALQTEYLRMILHFLYLLVCRDYENLCLLMNFKPKIFVNAFYETNSSLYDFLELISEMLFSTNNTYKFDNFYFYTECLNEILFKLNFDNEKNEIKLEESLAVFERVMRLVRRTISCVSMTQPDPLNCIENVIYNLRIIKNDQTMNSMITDYFFKGHNLEIERPEDAPMTTLEKFLSSYFLFVNDLIINNLYFFGLIQEDDFLLELTTVEYILNEINSEESEINLPVEIEIPMMRFYLEISLTFDIKLMEIDRQLENLFMRNIPKYIKNVSLLHLQRNMTATDENAGNHKHETVVLIAKTNFLIKFLKKFEIKFEKISKSYLKQEKFVERKVFLLNFLEHCVIRPSFIIFNRFLLYLNYIKGNECYSIYELTFHFLKSLVYFYENIEKLSVNKCDENLSNIHEGEKSSNSIPNTTNNLIKKTSIKLKNQLANFISQPVEEEINNNNISINKSIFLKNDNELRLLKQEEIYDFEEISIKSELDISIINEISDEIFKFTNNQIKYFEMDAIYSTFISNLQKILKSQKNDEEEELSKSKEESSQDLQVFPTRNILQDGFAAIYTRFRTKTQMMTKKVMSLNKKPKELDRIKKLITKYQDKIKNTYDDNLSIIKVMDSPDSDNEAELGVELFNYIISKFSDSLTDYNFRLMNNNYKVGDVAHLNIQNFKFQNSYILIYLNALFYNDSEKFQQILEDNIGDNYDIFFNFLTRKLIMPSVLCEVKKVYELDKFSENSFQGIPMSYEISTIAIKFLQNICESHNQEFQNRFFNFLFDLEVQEYKYKDYCGSEEKINKTFLTRRTTIGFGALSSKKDTRDQQFGNSMEKYAERYNFETKKTFQSENENTDLQGTVVSSKKARVLLRPQLEAVKDDQSSHKEVFEKKKQREKEERETLGKKKLSFLNFICHHMRIVYSHLHLDNEFNSSLLRKNRELKNYENLLEIYQRFSDLIVEMIQGTANKNFDNFYRKLPDGLNIFDETGTLFNFNTLDSFVFILKSLEIKNMLLDTQRIFDSLALPMKINLFFTINNLINQEVADISLVKIFITIFPPDKIIELVSMYVRGLYINHILKCEYESKEFYTEYEDFELSNETYSELIHEFKADNEIYEDEFFKLASQMYLFLTVLGEKYSVPEAERILKLDKREVIIVHEEPDANEEQNKTMFNKIMTYFKSKLKNSGFMQLGIELHGEQEKRKKKKIKHHTNNLIITSKFLNKTIHSCEFMIDSSNEDGSELKLKKIYFIIDPRVYLISKNNIQVFFDEVDRSSSTTKLKSLIDKLNFFMSEVDYKYSNLKKSKYLKWMLEVDYKDVDFINFCLSLLINIILLIFLQGDALETGNVYYFTVLLAFIQILFNVAYLFIFAVSKYKFYILVQKTSSEKKSLSIMEWINIHLLDSFFFNDEIYLMILNIIIGCLGILSTYATFLFSLQLLTVIKFVPTIKEIVIAFKLRFSQLLSMVGFLAILIYFYSNIGFFFLSNEFVKTLDNGQTENLCSTLLGCSVTYFNLGVRSGGGIGDILEMKPYRDTSIYWIRWLSDMIFYITVILLLLNMINGVIVSTFSQIREESNEKEEDINNKCFICNIDRVEFEKRKIAFSDHLKYEHNTKTYIRFLIYLRLLNEKDLDADQGFIINCIKERDISCFPVLRSFSVGNMVQSEDGNEAEGED